MKLNDFRKKMLKGVFTLNEAERVAWESSPATLRLQLHQWAKAGELVRLKRGLYAFPELLKDQVAVARALYSPCYISLEYALHAYGLLPDVAFTMTLVTPKITRRFTTPVGSFHYRKIRENLFWGYDPDTLMGEREKVLVDYFYLNSSRLRPEPDFWEALRLQNLRDVNFDKVQEYAVRFQSEKAVALAVSLKKFARGYGKTKTNR